MAADLAGGSEKHLLICELNPFDLKINRNKLVRATEGSSCHALHAVALELAAVLQHCDSRTTLAVAPKEKQAADGVIIVPAPNRHNPWCDFNISCPLFGRGSCPRVLAVGRRPGFKRSL